MAISLIDAVKLYEVIGDFLPKSSEGSLAEYGYELIKNIKGVNPKAFIASLEIMTGYAQDELLGMLPKDLYELFLRSIVDNEVLKLAEWMEGFGYGHA